MATTARITFDRDVYAPGDPIAATITVTIEDAEPETREVTGTVTLSTGDVLTFAGEVKVDPPTPVAIGVSITGSGGFTWSQPLHPTPDTYVITAVAE